MKVKFLVLAVMIVMIGSACSRKTVVVHKKSTHVHKMPPGHAKKIHGDKSARNYAPGHQKKKH
ncbi:hypothetical protein [Longitalea arenae]|uniref:hypothetical protein n=1 Tax=Longitalea arenae TaxID=2812558 RepID=UPI0019689944|nr:hypothetical protein [Longitalea arenae]